MESKKTVRYATAGGAETHAIHTGYTAGSAHPWRTQCTGGDWTVRQDCRAAALEDAQVHARDCNALPPRGA